MPAWLGVLLLAAVVAFACQGSRHLWEPDEGRYTAVASLMLATGDWMTPRLDEERPHYTKPPVTYWLVAASLGAFGNNEWSARLPNAFAFVATALLVLGIARRLLPDHAPFAAAVWVTMAGPALAANIITPDTLLALFETLALYGFVAASACEPGRPLDRGRLRLMWLGFALAFATKGPPGLLPLAAILAWMVRQGRWRELPSVLAPLGLAVFVVVGLGWYVAVVARDPGLLGYFLQTEVVERVASDDFRRNSGDWAWFSVYGPVLLVGLMPWLAVWVATRVSRVAAPDVVATRPWTGSVASLLHWWILLPLVVLCLARSRMPLYVLPLFVPLALWLAGGIASSRVAWARAPVFTWIAAAAVLAVKLWAATLHPDTDSHRLSEKLRPWIATGRYEGIAFIDAVPFYGLRHYTGLPVRHLDLPGHSRVPRGYVPPPGLCERPGDPVGRLLYLTFEHDVPIADREARRCGWPGLVRLGHAGRYSVLARRPDPPVTAGAAPLGPPR